MISRSLASRSCLIVLSLFLTATAVTAQSERDWPQFRGRNVDGISVEGDVFPDASPPALETSWRRALGSGYSGISVAGGLAVTMFTDGESNVLIAFDAKSGSERWRFPMSPNYKGHDGSYDGPISTPLIDGRLTVALGPAGRLFAVDNLDGELVWTTDLVEDHGAVTPLYGFASSPISEDGTLILQIGRPDGALAGFDRATGERRWMVGDDVVDYQNALPTERGGQRYILAAGHKQVMAVDPGSGDLLWQYEHGGGGARGVWSMVPVLAGPDRIFLAFKDTSSAVFGLDGQRNNVSGQLLWEERTIRNSYTVPVYHEGYLYAYSSRFLTCVDAATGKAMWKSRPPGDGFLILVDGHLVIQTKAGSLHVAKASPEGYEEVARLDLFEDLAWTPPSFADGSVFVRSLGEIARVDIRSDRRPSATDAASNAGDEDKSDFAGMLRDVAAARDKTVVVDAFFDSHTEFPLVEDGGRVHFVYRGEATDVAIAGDMIGARQEAPMTLVEGTDLFYYSTELDPAAYITYLFVRDYEELIDPLNPRTAQSAIFAYDMEMQMRGAEKQMSALPMPGWTAPAHLEDPVAGTARGRVASHELRSAILDRAHTVKVYLPPGYDGSEDRYPTIYFHAGTDALARGDWLNTLDNLRGKTIEPAIVVFLDVGAGGIFDSRDDYGEAWAREVVPFVDDTYRTRATKEARAHVGVGISAHEALHCAFKYPELSSKLAFQSLLLADYGHERFTPLVRAADEQPLDIYMDWGKYDLRNPQEAWDIRASARELAEWLRSRGYDVDARESLEGTGWPSWKHRNDAVLESLFPLQ